MLGGPQGQSEQVRKISPPPGFDPRTVHPVASCYNDYAIWPSKRLKHLTYFTVPTLYTVHTVCGVVSYGVIHNQYLPDAQKLRSLYGDVESPK